MIRKIQLIILRLILPKLLNKKSPDRIPRSGAAGAAVDCFSCHFVSENQPLYLVDDFIINEDKIKVRAWDSSTSSFDIKQKIKISELKPEDFRVEHYYGLNTVHYSGVYDIFINYYIKIVYFNILIRNILENIFQKTYNMKAFKPISRIELLKFIVNQQFLQDIQQNKRWMSFKNKEFSKFSLMTELHSVRWTNHPFGGDEMNKLGMYLDSLVMTEDLERSNNGTYKITGKAIDTLEKYRESEQRHKDALRIQTRIFWLTFFIALVGLFTMIFQFLGPSNYFIANPIW